MQIGQRVQINGTNTARKEKEGIPIGAPAVIYNFSKAPGRPTVYNVMTNDGEKYALVLREFKLMAPILVGKEVVEEPVKVEEDGVSSKKNEDPEGGQTE